MKGSFWRVPLNEDLGIPFTPENPPCNCEFFLLHAICNRRFLGVPKDLDKMAFLVGNLFYVGYCVSGYAISKLYTEQH